MSMNVLIELRYVTFEYAVVKFILDTVATHGHSTSNNNTIILESDVPTSSPSSVIVRCSLSHRTHMGQAQKKLLARSHVAASS